MLIKSRGVSPGNFARQRMEFSAAFQKCLFSYCSPENLIRNISTSSRKQGGNILNIVAPPMLTQAGELWNDFGKLECRTLSDPLQEGTSRRI